MLRFALCLISNFAFPILETDVPYPPMLSRRAFLAGSLGFMAGAASAIHAGETTAAQGNINDTLLQIAEVLRAKPIDATVDVHLHDAPTHALVQWRWMHFQRNLSGDLFWLLEKVNRELLRAMRAVRTLPDAQLDDVVLEGLVEGRVHEHLAQMVAVHRELVATQLQRVFNARRVGRAPDESDVEAALSDERRTQMPVLTSFHSGTEQRYERVSPRARLGAAYVLSAYEPVTLSPAEHPTIDAHAEAAEHSGDAEECKRWVFVEREHYIVEMLRRRRRINHLLMGYNHTFTDDIAECNETQPEKFSHIVVSVQGIASAEIWEANRQKASVEK